MRRTAAAFIACIAITAGLSPAPLPAASETAIRLSAPRTDGGIAVEKALKERRSVRGFAPKPLTKDELSQLLWAAQGITNEKGNRTAPSAMASYPLEVYVLAADVTGLAPGTYRYKPQGHEITLLSPGDRREQLEQRGARQGWIKSAPAVFFITGVVSRTARGERPGNMNWVWVEAGLAAQGFFLEAVSLGLGSTYVGGFDPAGIKEFLRLPEGEEPLAVLPVGRPK